MGRERERERERERTGLYNEQPNDTKILNGLNKMYITEKSANVLHYEEKIHLANNSLAVIFQELAN